MNAPANVTLEHQIKLKLIETLGLKTTPEKIDDHAPIFFTGLGLDSVDALEVVGMLSEHFNVELADSKEAKGILKSISSIADYVRQQSAA